MGICVVGLSWEMAMLDDFSLQALIAYAEAYPVVATFLLLVVVVLLGSLLRKFFKVVVVCAVVLLVGLYFTQGDDAAWWERVEAIGSEVVVWGEALLEKADELFEKGKQQLEGN